MRRFSLYQRGKTFYVRYWDPNTGTYTPGKSTRETEKRAAMAVAALWDREGFPDGGTVSDFVDIHAIVETIRTGSIDRTHAKRITDALVERGLIASVVIANDGPAAEPLVSYLRGFWAFDTSTYVAEKKAYGQSIGRRHCEDSTGRLVHWERFYGEALLGEVTPESLRRFQMTLRDNGLAARTINAILDAGRVALAWLADRGEIPESPAEGLRRFSGKSKERGILTTKEQKALFSVQWYDERSRVANLTACVGGLRAGEVLALRPADIGDDRLYVRHAWGRVEGLKGTKTGEEREVPIGQEIRRELLRLAADNPHGSGPGRYVFYSDDPAAPMSENILRRGLERALVEMVVPAPQTMTKDEREPFRERQRAALQTFRERGVCFHSWRHAYTTALAAQLELRQVQLATGHRTQAMAEHYSAHRRDEDFQALSEATGKVFRHVLPFKQAAG